MISMKAKFNSKCAATGTLIKKGDVIIYDPKTKKAYKPGNEPQPQPEPPHEYDAWINDFLIDNYYH